MSTTAVKERPIIFSAPMVRAILDGRKTQTRRIVKGAEYFACLTGDCPHDRQSECDESMPLFCPYGKVGDRLWVRETWANGIDNTSQCLIAYRASPGYGRLKLCDNEGEGDPVGIGDDVSPAAVGPWRPSIHMPRWASRIALELTEVRVQRVQDIGHDGRRAAGVMAEGITPEQIAIEQKWFHPDDAPAIAFSRLWESVNGKGSWSRNDWVWAITFRRVEATNV
jgi:hypothetical protein